MSLILRKARILLGWDLIVSAAVVGAFWYVAPDYIASEFARDLYALGASVLSVVFSVFIAALAMIMSSSGDRFLDLLKKTGTYEVTLFGFKYTLWLLFVGLVAALGFYALTAWSLSQGNMTQPTWMLMVFVFLLLYGVSATLEAALTAVRHSRLHLRYLSLSEDDRDFFEDNVTP